jgi:hypothetical protein
MKNRKKQEVAEVKWKIDRKENTVDTKEIKERTRTILKCKYRKRRIEKSGKH